MKLRHRLAHLDPCFRLGVSSACVSNVINKVIPVLAKRLQFRIPWPSAEVLRKNMPLKFKKRFKKCVVIIDCTVFHWQAHTWSNYKHRNTLKDLISITPYGSTSFISKMWGGRISDKEISVKSGDGRGFLIGDNLAWLGATLVMPPFLNRVFLHRENVGARLSRFPERLWQIPSALGNKNKVSVEKKNNKSCVHHTCNAFKWICSKEASMFQVGYIWTLLFWSIVG